MLYIDLPTRDEIRALSQVREQGCVSIYLKTTPITREIYSACIELGNFIRDAVAALQELNLPKREISQISDALQALLEDDAFWIYQAHSLAIFVTASQIRTYRLPNKLNSMMVVSDRLHLKPLFRAVTFPHSAFILALSENAVRLIEVNADLPPQVIMVEDMPQDAASSAGLASIKGRSHYRRMAGAEGQNIRLEQYARKVDTALRPLLSGREVPLILAATGRLASVFQLQCSYPHLLKDQISDSPDRMSEAELAAAARPLLDQYYTALLEESRDLFSERKGQRRTTTDLSDAARAATFGAVQLLMVDIDAMVPGFVDDDSGEIRFAMENEAEAYGVVDEITARALASGARILGVRREDLPADGPLAAILRYPI